jgi:hypothetical protein
MAVSTTDNYILGLYDDEDLLMEAVRNVRKSGVLIEEVYSPFPIHGLDEALGYTRSRLPIAAFLFGILGTTLALVMQIYMMGVDWPMIIGGKDFVALPSFIPVTFELTVLLSALGMVAVFLIVSNLKPYGRPRIYDLRSTDNLHVMAINLKSNRLSPAEIKDVLASTHALEINEKSFELV